MDEKEPRTRAEADDVEAVETACPSVLAQIPLAATSPLAQLRIATRLFLARAVDQTLWRGVYACGVPRAELGRKCTALEGFLAEGRVGLVVFAVLVNHVRRMVVKGSVVGGFGGVVAGVKMAVGSPDILLKEEFEVSRFWWGKGLGDLLGLMAGEVLVRFEARRGEREMVRREEKGKVVAAVVLVVWMLGAAEYVHARVAHLVAVGIAYWRMVNGGEVYHEALWRVFCPEGPSLMAVIKDGAVGRAFVTGFWGNKHRFQILFFHADLLVYAVYGVYPLLKVALTRALGMVWVRGKGWRWVGMSPWLAVLIAGWAWGTGFVARYSNKYFIGLQMCDMVLVGWWIILVGGAFGWGLVKRRVGRLTGVKKVGG